jgi:hypothetical protein
MTSPTPGADLLEREIEEQSAERLALAKRPQLAGRSLIEGTPELSASTKITGNDHYCILTSLLSRRIPTLSVMEKDIQLATTLHKSSPQSVESILKRRILPIELKGHGWDSTHSKRLRRGLNADIRPYMDVLSLYSGPMAMDMLRIKASDTMSWSEKADQFRDVYMYVEKKPKKRKGDSAGITSAFMRMYRNGRKYSVGVMVKALSDNRKLEGNAADHVAEGIISQINSRVGADECEISNAIRGFMKEYNVKAREMFNSVIGFGVVVGDRDGMHIMATRDISFYKMENNRMESVFKSSSKNIGEDIQIVKGKGRMMYIDTGIVEGPQESRNGEGMLIALNSSASVPETELKRRFRSDDLESMGKAIVREVKSGRVIDDLGVMVFSRR